MRSPAAGRPAPGWAVEPRTSRSTLDAILGELHGNRTLLERQAGGPVDDPARTGELLEMIAEAMHDLDLPFTAGEVLEGRHRHHGLDVALDALHLSTTSALGTWLKTCAATRWRD